MVDGGYGQWQDEEKTICNLSWKSIPEWGNIIYNWVCLSNLVFVIVEFFSF